MLQARGSCVEDGRPLIGGRLEEGEHLIARGARRAAAILSSFVILAWMRPPDAQTVQSGRSLPTEQAVAVAPSRLRAPASSPEKMSGRLDVAISRGETIHLTGPATNIFVADPAIADIQT